MEAGTRVALVGPWDTTRATHEVLGPSERGYLRICPIGKLQEVQPGQEHVPVTRITPERLVRVPA